MVGVVIVSHSVKVSDGIRDLAMQMSGDADRIVSAGGLEDGSIGTDTVRIMEAIERADDGDGVVIFADLGSAIMSTETALELLADAGSEIVAKIADCAILEGAVCAAVEAMSGSNLEEVLQAALEGASMSKL